MLPCGQLVGAWMDGSVDWLCRSVACLVLTARKLKDRAETSVPPELEANPKLNLTPLSPLFASLASWPKVLFLPLAALKFAHLAISLAKVMLPEKLGVGSSKYIIVQVRYLATMFHWTC